MPREQGAHVCTALDLPWFRHVALQTPFTRTGNIRRLPHPLSAPHDPGHPLSNRALFPRPQLTKVTYSLAASSERRFGWGRKLGEEVCVERARGHPQMRGQTPAFLLEGGSLVSSHPAPSGAQPSPVGRSRTLCKFPQCDPEPLGWRYEPYGHPKPLFQGAWGPSGVFRPTERF